MGSPPTDTIPTLRKVLVVLRNLTTLNRLVDVLPALFPDSRLAVKFVIDKGSFFASGLAKYSSHDLQMDVVSWSRATRTRWDLVIAAHANARLRKLRGPLVVLPHGAGYSRIVPWSTGSRSDPTGLAKRQLSWRGKVLPTAIGLSHEDQREQLRSAYPAAVDRAFVMGDPTFDRLRANIHRRQAIRARLNIGGRCLVVVTSTWGKHSSFANDEALAMRLVAQLPADSWKVALVLHPNVWLGSSSGWEIRSQLADALESGLLLIPPDKGWQAALIAADVVVGDHGSVSFYGAALGRPVLLPVTGLAELAPDSPRVLLSMMADRLDVDGDLLVQIEAAIRQHDPDRITAVTDKTLGRQGESLPLLREELYRLARLDPPRGRPKLRPLPDPEPITGCAPTAYLMRARVQATTGDAGRVELSRYPALLGEYRCSEAPEDLFSVVDDTEVDVHHRQSAEIMVCGEPLGEAEAMRWIDDIRRECVGAALFAVCVGSRFLLQRHDGPLYQATVSPVRGAGPARPDSMIAAAALYGWIAAKLQVSSCGITLHVRIGADEYTVEVLQISRSAIPP